MAVKEKTQFYSKYPINEVNIIPFRLEHGRHKYYD